MLQGHFYHYKPSESEKARKILEVLRGGFVAASPLHTEENLYCVVRHRITFKKGGSAHVSLITSFQFKAAREHLTVEQVNYGKKHCMPCFFLE